MIITANELKTKGVKAIEQKIKNNDRLLLTVRGKTKYVVVSIEEYDKMKEAELDLAILKTKKDIEEGRYTVETAEEHLKRLWND